AGIPQDGGAPFRRRRRGVRFGRKSDGWHAVSRECCLGHKLNSQQRKRVRSDDSIIAKFQDWLLLWNFISHNTLGPYQRLRSTSTWLTYNRRRRAPRPSPCSCARRRCGRASSCCFSPIATSPPNPTPSSS